MARSFSENEKEHIRERLLSEGRRLFIEAGIRKTSVEEIAEAVGISKGSFYTFFSSKMELCFALIEEEEKRKWEIIEPSPEGKEASGVEGFFRRARLMVEENELIRAVYRRGEFEYLIRERPEGFDEENRREDDRFSGAVISRWREEGIPVSIEAATLTALLRIFFFASLPEDEVGKGYAEAMDLVYRAVAAEIEEDTHG